MIVVTSMADLGESAPMPYYSALAMSAGEADIDQFAGGNLSEDARKLWLNNYITTLLERDLPQLGFRTPSNTLRRFWQMLCHYHGNIMNYAELAGTFGVSDNTIRHYIDKHLNSPLDIYDNCSNMSLLL